MDARREAATIAGRRRVLGLSVVALAVRVGYSPAYISTIEAGYVPHTDAVARICSALDELEQKAGT